MRQVLTRITLLVSTALLLLGSLTQSAYAVSPQRKGIERYPFYDKTAELLCGGVSGAGGSSAPAQSFIPQSGPLYFLGDSIGVGLKQAGLEAQLTGSGYQPQMNVSTSRSISGKGIDAGFKTSGLEAIDGDANFIKTANTVIIELGTNPENNFAGNLNTLVDKIKGLNANARIYLIDVAASPQAAQRIGAADTNKAIYTKASSLGTPVISRFKLYYPNGDPQTYGGATNPALPFDGLGVHSTSAPDYQKLNDLVKTTLSSPGISQPPTSSACCPAQGVSAPGIAPGAPLTGNSNVEKIYNYLRAKGLTLNQAAGIMGNMKAESDFDPAAVEKGGTGIGIIQWSFGRNTALRQAAAAKGVPWQDLGFQLDYMWQELTTSYKKSVLDPLLASVSVEDAVNIWLTKYEIPADIPGQRPVRTGFAYSVLRQFGGSTGPIAVGAPSNTTGGTGTTSPNCANGTTTTVGGTASNQIVAVALQEMAAGASELNGGYLKYTDGAQENWCADFVSWVLKQAGVPFTGGTSGGWRIPAVNNVQAWFQAQNKYHAARSGYVPQPGDIIIFNQGTGSWPQHVAIVVAVSGKSVTFIGGNQAKYYITKNTLNDYDYAGVSGYGTP